MKNNLESLQTRIDHERMILDKSNGFAVNHFNAMVDEFNTLREDYNNAVRSHNESGRNRQYSIRTIVSVGGGINLRPKDFAKPLLVLDSSPLIQRIRSSRNVIRSSPGTVDGKVKIAAKRNRDMDAIKRLYSPWKLVNEQSSGDLIKRRWSTSNQGSISVEVNSKSGYEHHQVTTKGYFSKTTVKPGRREVLVATFAYPTEIVATGDFSEGGTIILRRGKKIDRQMLQRDSSDTRQRGKWVRSGKLE